MGAKLLSCWGCACLQGTEQDSSGPSSAAVAEQDKQMLQQQPLPQLAVAAAAAAAGSSAAVLHEDDAFEAEVLSAGGGAVDFTAVKAAVLAAEGVDAAQQGLMGRGFLPTQQQQQQQQQQRPQPPPQHHVQVLQQLLAAARQLQAASAGQVPLQLQHFMQRSASVPPSIAAHDNGSPSPAAAAAAASALHEQQLRGDRSLERSASTGTLGSDPGAGGVQPGGAAAASAGQGVTSPQAGHAHAHGVHAAASAMAAAAAAAAAAGSQAGGDTALLQQLQQQQVLLLHHHQQQQQQQAAVQQQQQPPLKDVLNGDFDLLTYNLQMAKSYMFGRPPPSPPPPQPAAQHGNHHSHGSKQHQQQQQHAQQQLAGYLMPSASPGLLGPDMLALLQGPSKLQQMMHADVHTPGSSVQQSPVHHHLRTLVQMGAASPTPLATLQGAASLDAADMHAAALRGLPHPLAQHAQHNQQLLHAVLAQQQQQQQQQQSLLHVLQHQQLPSVTGSNSANERRKPQPPAAAAATATTGQPLSPEDSSSGLDASGTGGAAASSARTALNLEQQQDANASSRQQQEVLGVDQLSALEAAAAGLAPAVCSPPPAGGSSAPKYTPPHRRSPATGSLGSGGVGEESSDGRRQSMDSLVLSPRHQQLDAPQMRRSSGALVRAVAAALGQEDASSDAGEAEGPAGPPDGTDDSQQQQQQLQDGGGGGGGDSIGAAGSVAAAPQSMAPIKTAAGTAGNEALGAGAAQPDGAGGAGCSVGEELDRATPPGGDLTPSAAAAAAVAVSAAAAGPSATPKTPLSATAAPFVSLRFAASSAAAAAAAYGVLPTAAGTVGLSGSAAAAAAVGTSALGDAGGVLQEGLMMPVGALRHPLPGHVMDADQASTSDYASADSTHYESTPGTPVVSSSSQGMTSGLLFAGSQGAEGSSHSSLPGDAAAAGLSAEAAAVSAAEGPGQQQQHHGAVESVGEGSAHLTAAAAAGAGSAAVPVVMAAVVGQQPRAQPVHVTAVQQQQLAALAAANGLAAASDVLAVKQGDQQGALQQQQQQQQQQQMGQPPPPPPRPDLVAGQQQSMQRLLQQQQQQQQLLQLQLQHQLHPGLLLQTAGRALITQQPKKAKLSSGQGLNTVMLAGFADAERAAAAMVRQGSGSGPGNAAAGQAYQRHFQQQPQQQPQHWQAATVTAAQPSSSRHKPSQQQQLAAGSLGSGTFEVGSLDTVSSGGARELVFTPTGGAAAVSLQPGMVALAQQQQQWRRSGGSAAGADAAAVAAAAGASLAQSLPLTSGAQVSSSAGGSGNPAATLLLQQQHQHAAPRALLQPQQPQQLTVQVDGFVASSSMVAADASNPPLLLSQATYPGPTLGQVAVSRALELQQSLPLSPRTVAAGFSLQHPAVSAGLQRAATEPRNSTALAVLPLTLQQQLLAGQAGVAGSSTGHMTPLQLQLHQAAAMQFAALNAAASLGVVQQLPKPWGEQSLYDWQQHQQAAANMQQQQQAAANMQQQQQQPGVNMAAMATAQPPQPQQQQQQGQAQKQPQQQQQQQQQCGPAGGSAGGHVVPEKRSSSGTPSNLPAAPNSYMQPQPLANSTSSSHNNSSGGGGGAAVPVMPGVVGALPMLSGGSLMGSQPHSATAAMAMLTHFGQAFGLAQHPGFPAVPWLSAMVPPGPHGFAAALHTASAGGGPPGAPTSAGSGGGGAAGMPPSGTPATRTGTTASF